jgi:amidase
MDANPELYTKTLTEVANLIESKQVSPVELTRAMLERIETTNPHLHSYLTVTADLALQQAAQAERQISRGEYRGPLHGVPIAVKDLIYTKDARTTCASKILSDWTPDYDATVIERLYRAGAVLLGKLTLTEFAGIGYHPTVPPALNPWDTNRWTGSSSSGSGVAMAASLCFGTLGTDTGGSLRFPAAACGVVGLKPTYGKVSRYGVYPLADSLDHVGPITRRVEDAASILQAIAGFDRNDPTSRQEQVTDYRAELKTGVKGVRIGVDWHFCSNRVDSEITDSIVRAGKLLSDLGARVEEVSLSGIEKAPASWGVIFTAECAVAHEATFPERAEDYSLPFRNFLEQSDQVSGADYVKATMARRRISQMIKDRFQNVDLLLCPTIGMVPMKLDGAAPEEVITPEVGNDLLSLTSPFSLSGSPAIAVPCGFSRDGLPISLQLIGRHDEESLLLRAAYAYEETTEWHKKLPPATE